MDFIKEQEANALLSIDGGGNLFLTKQQLINLDLLVEYEGNNYDYVDAELVTAKTSTITVIVNMHIEGGPYICTSEDIKEKLYFGTNQITYTTYDKFDSLSDGLVITFPAPMSFSNGNWDIGKEWWIGLNFENLSSGITDPPMPLDYSIVEDLEFIEFDLYFKVI